MVNTNDNSIHANIILYREKLEEVNKFCYLGATLTRDRSCETDIRIRVSFATSAIVRLYTLWNSKQLHFELKHNLYRSLVLLILTYECETWTINAATQKKYKLLKINRIGNYSVLHIKRGKQND